MTHWIELKFRKPDEIGWYLTYSKRTGVKRSYWHNDGFYVMPTNFQSRYLLKSITHWTLMPNPPIN